MDVAVGREEAVIVCMPQQVGKSTLCSRYFLAWLLGTMPETRAVLVGYEASFAAYWGMKVRDTIQTWGRQVYGVGIRESMAARNAWETGHKDGGMRTVGVGQGVSGKPTDVFVLDDLIQDLEHAEEHNVAKVWDWWQSVGLGRLRPGTRLVGVMTRWPGNDFVARLLDAWGEKREGGKVRLINFPAIATDHDELGREPGAALWPEQRPLAWWLERRDGPPGRPSGGVPARVWAAMYQQDPMPPEGSTYKKAWFDNNVYPGAIPAMAKACSFRALSLDTASKTGVHNDYSAFVVGGIAEAHIPILHVEQERLDFPGLIAKTERLAREWDVHVILVEDASSGQQLIQWLRSKSRLPVLPIKPQGSKSARADAVTPMWHSGVAQIPAYAPWLSILIRQHLEFTGQEGKLDDIVDATNQLLAHLRGKTGTGPKFVVF